MLVCVSVYECVYLVVHVFDDQQHGAVQLCQVPVESLQTGAVSLGSVRPSPWIPLHTGRQASSQLQTGTSHVNRL